jgi:hypothetical protein
MERDGRRLRLAGGIQNRSRGGGLRARIQEAVRGAQGYDNTSDSKRISPEDIELVVEPVKT